MVYRTVALDKMLTYTLLIAGPISSSPCLILLPFYLSRELPPPPLFKTTEFLHVAQVVLLHSAGWHKTCNDPSTSAS